MPNIPPLTMLGAILVILGVGLAIAPVSLGGNTEGQLDYKVYSIDSLMTAVYKVYGDENLGFWVAKTVVKNPGSGPLYDVKISYKIEGLTDWSEPRTYTLVPPGGSVVDLYYPIITKNPNLQTSTPSTLYIKIQYKTTKNGDAVTKTVKKPIKLLALHDFVFSGIPPEENTGSFQDVFSNYPLLAAWVTPKDPVVESYADIANKLAGGAGASLNDNEALSYLSALWSYSVMNGITYQTEPNAFWTGKMAQYVKFPRDVIKDRSGTCIDTSIFFASLAMTQGLKAYIILIPGHAFPVVELPSGQLVPIESTLLNSKTSFEAAVQTGVENFQKAMQGPHLIVDIQSLQASGIVPPELPQLPPNVLAQWGYTIPGQGQMGQGGYGYGGNTQGGGNQQGGGQQGGQAGGAGGGQTGTGGGGSVLFSNPLGGPQWTIRIPGDWSHQEFDEDPWEVDLYSPDDNRLIMITWSTSYSEQDLLYMLASWFNDTFGGYSIAGDNPNGKLGNINAETIAFNLADGSFSVARITEVDGYSLLVAYVIDHSISSQDEIYAMEDIISTFNVR